MLRERTLIAEAGFARDFADEAVVLLEQFARGLDAHFQNERLRAAAESLNELAVQLPRRKVRARREFADGQAFAEALADERHGAVNREVRLAHLAAESV